MENIQEKIQVVMNLEGLDGNAFAILGAFKKNARRQGFSDEQIDRVITKAQGGDYELLLQVIIENTISNDENVED